MNNGPALTHRSAASAWPRGRPQASAQERIPLRWHVLGGAQSLLFCSGSRPRLSPGSLSPPPCQHLLRLPVPEVLNSSLPSPGPSQPPCSPASFRLHSCIPARGREPVLTSFPSHAHLGPAEMFPPSFLRCGGEAVQQPLDEDIAKHISNPSGRALSCSG